MNISIKTIANDQHRPGISGADWFWNGEGDLEVRVSKMSDWRFEMALALHEVAEALLCKYNGVLQSSVDDFDMEWELNNPNSKIEAGDQPDAPYRREHGFATAIERIFASEVGLDWKAYDQELESL